MKNILILSTFPSTNPKHGGQLRLSNIIEVYKKNGWKVTSLVIYDEAVYSQRDAGAHAICFPSNSAFRLYDGVDVPFITDLLSGYYAVSDNGCWFDVLKKIPDEIDVIQAEQPWLWQVANRLKGTLKKKPLIIYSSHNIEYSLKKEILSDYQLPVVAKILSDIALLEKSAAVNSDICFAVTQNDLETLNTWGGKSYLAPNGISPWAASSKKLSEWKKKLPKSPWLLYVASAHPPNHKNITQLFGNSLGCFPPSSALVVAGSVCQNIYKEFEHTQCWKSLNYSRLQLLDLLEDEDLSAVKPLAHGFVLPILIGGGSNIKTAEALYSNAYVVSTTAALRGYDAFEKLPGIYVANTPCEFHESIKEVLSLPSRANKEDTRFSSRDKFTWSSCLEMMPNIVEKLFYEKGNHV